MRCRLVAMGSRLSKPAKPHEVSTHVLHFHDVRAEPVAEPSWLSQVAAGKGTTIVSVYPSAMSADEAADESAHGTSSAAPEGLCVPPASAANDNRPTAGPDATAVPPVSAVRLSDIPKAPKALDTLLDELVPRADEEAAKAIAEAVGELAAARQTMLEQAEDDLFSLVRLVSERVLLRELRTDPDVAMRLVREGLMALSAGDHITVRLGDFYRAVVNDVREVVSDAGVKVHVSVDAHLSPHACIVESQWGRVDESVDTRLRILLDQLDAARVRSSET